MITGKIITKNIKLLLRSRVSSLVIILGPLLVIMLVGLSFSTEKFNLSMGVYSNSYSELSESLVEELQKEYSVIRFDDEDSCINSIKEGSSHACIIFPPDMVVDESQQNTIIAYVDQSKVNLVYLVMSNLVRSLGQKTTEISKDLAEDVTSALIYTKDNLVSTESDLKELIEKNNEIAEGSDASISDLNRLDLDFDTYDLNAETESIREELDLLLDESSDLIDDGLDFIDDLKDEDLNSNQTSIVNKIESKLEDLNSTVSERQNSTAEELTDFIEDMQDTFLDISEKLSEAGEVNSKVLSSLQGMNKNAEDLKEKSEKLNEKVENILSRINSIQVLNSESIISPIKTEIAPIVKSQSNLGFLFPTLIVMMIMFIGLLLPSTLIIMEKNSKAYFRVFTTPTSNRLFLIATYLTSMILVFVQIMIILLVSQFYFKINFFNSFFVLTYSLILIVSFFIFAGMFIGHAFNTEEMALMASISLGTLFLLTSGIIFPIESMPDYFIQKARFNPVVLGSEMFKRTLLFDASFSSVNTQAGYLALFSLILVAAIILVKKSNRIQFILKKPTMLREKKEYTKNLFDFGERKAKTLAEFIVSIQNLNEEKFISLLKQSAYKNWIVLVYKNKALAKKVEMINDKETLIKTLVDELKSLSPQKK